MWAAYLLVGALRRRRRPPPGRCCSPPSSPMMLEHTLPTLGRRLSPAMLVALGYAGARSGTRPATAGALLGLALWARPVTAARADRAGGGGPVLTGGVIDKRGSAAPGPWRRPSRWWAAALDQHHHVRGALDHFVRPHPSPSKTGSQRVDHGSAPCSRIPIPGRAAAHVREPRARPLSRTRPQPIVAGGAGVAGAAWQRAGGGVAALAILKVGFVACYVLYRYFNARFFLGWEALLTASRWRRSSRRGGVAGGWRWPGALRAAMERLTARLQAPPPRAQAEDRRGSPSSRCWLAS